ncbi:hypothetical protein FRC02_008741 [Tulasnella sp. 418]|nr:hypothetical protein FRC02_008741 [Tulasnella sp. 418]
MNGDQDSPSTQQDRRMSVWNVLDRMVPYSQPSRGLATPSGDNNQTPELSIMLYAPIIPDENSQVTLAKSKLMKVEAAENVPLLPRVVAKSVFSALLPQEFKLRYGKKDGGAQASVKIMLRGKNEECSEVKVWIPSGTALSLQVTWWGYRIWLPPPAMSILGDKTVVAAQQAAMLTASLTWITSNVPLIVLGPHLGAVLGLLRALVPILGDVGLFVASRWDQVKSFDKGQGVVLSATWLAPMALTPSSWTDYDYENDIASVSGRAASTLAVIPLPHSGTLNTSTPATGYNVKPGQPENIWTPDKKLLSKL